MINYLYLFSLVFSLLGLLFADKKYNLVFFGKDRLPIWILLVSISFFLVWDIVGILLGVFATNQDFVSGLKIFSPNLPFEEVLFLLLLTYTTLTVRKLIR